MAGIKISALPAAGSALLTDVFPAVQAGVTYQESLQQVLDLFQGKITSLGAQTQAINMNTHLINNVVDPVSAQDAATKNYVDTVAQGLTIQGACRVATTGALTVTYANGAAGVGATLTNAGALAALQIDGVSLSVNDRVLVKDQASSLQNGIYTVTTVGSGAVAWVMTRATDYDQVAEINPGDLVIITAGTSNANSSWIETATVTAIGTDPITFSQFSASLPVTVPNGGTGATSFTAYSVICGGTTSTGAFQNVSGVGSLNQVLVSQGAGALPQWSSVPGLTPAALTKTDDTNVTLTLGGTPTTALLQATSLTLGWTGQLGLTRGGTAASLTASNGGIVYSTGSALAILSGTATAGLALLSGASTTPSWSTSPPITQVNVQRVVTAGAGTYTPTTGMKYVLVRAQGAGGAGGGAATTAAGSAAAGGGGGGGEYIEALFTAAQIGASKAYVVGTGGTAGTAGSNPGNNGSATTFNTTFIVANAGNGGGGGASSATATSGGTGGTNGNGGSVATGTLLRQISGQQGAVGSVYTGGTSTSGQGGDTGASVGAAGTQAQAGIAGERGGGGCGGSTIAQSAVSGGVGGDGFIEFIEFISV